MRASPTSRYVFIDALRGFAALAVVAFHAQKTEMLTALEPKLPAVVRVVFTHGVAGVFVFFVLSGFVIAHCTCREETTTRFAVRFMARRSIRLDPPYWASMVLAVALNALPAVLDASKPYVLPSAWDVFLHVTYLVELLGGHEIDAAYWTLCLEIQFYLVFLAVMAGVNRLSRAVGRERALNLILWPCVAFADLWALGAAPFEVRGLFVEHWYLFLAGTLVWRAREGERTAVRVAVLNMAVVGIATFWRGDYPAFVGLMSAAAILFVGLRGQLHTALRHRPFQFLGAISYSLYLIHNPVSYTVFRLGHWITGRGVAWELFWLVAAFACCIFAAWVFWRGIERPSLRLSRRISVRDPVRDP